jgi:hypothetical protein
LSEERDLLVKYADADIPQKPSIDMYESSLLDTELLTRPEWSAVGKYISYLGKTWDEIKKDYPETEYLEEYWYGVDPKTKIRFVLPIDSTCVGVYVPIKMLFPETEGTLSRKEFTDIFHANHTWNVDEYTCYIYEFPGINIYIHSKLDGSVSEDTFVQITLR